MYRRLTQIVLILLLLLLAFRGTSAKSAPARITIEGPGISELLEIDDEDLLESFGWGEFADFSTPVTAGTHTGEGYLITRYVLMGGTTMRSLDTFTYYPGAGDAGSIVFYKGIIDKKFIYGGTPQDGKWFRVSAEGESAIQRIFDVYGISSGENSSWHLFIPTNLSAWMISGSILAIAGVVILLWQQRRRLFS